ncbi:hypothetical protein H2202_003976 [Exophiala xenobiotica]|nr:hypothetical protein H2202_003976 [Exophiala xenobiotica]
MSAQEDARSDDDDWISYSSESSQVDSLPSTVKRYSWLTSYSKKLLRRASRRSRPGSDNSTPRQQQPTSGLGGARGVSTTPEPPEFGVKGAPSACAASNNSARNQLRPPGPLPPVPDTDTVPDLSSSHNSQTQIRTFAATHPTDRHSPRCERPNNPPTTRHGHAQELSQIYLLPPPALTSTLPLPHAHVWPEPARMDPSNPTQSPNLSDLLTGLSSREDASRKMAAFKLQSLINDPSFAEHFVLNGGLPRLRSLILGSSGNTLAYSLASFARLLEVDQGWEAVNGPVVEKARKSPV